MPTVPRTLTRQIHVGKVAVGGNAPITVQSMTTTKTADVDGTLSQVYALFGAGADIVRITCNDVDAAQGLAEIIPRSPVPIIADIHFQYRLALAALEAGVQGLRSQYPPPASTVAMAQNAGAMPSAAPSAPNSSGMPAWLKLSSSVRTPTASPPRPGGACA